ncbi:MAG: hypothetical protein ABGX16_07595 [Pirellulales bacterium]
MVDDFRTYSTSNPLDLSLGSQDSIGEIQNAPQGTSHITSAQKFGIAVTLLILAVVSLQFLTWQSNRELHTVMEIVATLLAMICQCIGICPVLYQKKQPLPAPCYRVSGDRGTGRISHRRYQQFAQLLDALPTRIADSMELERISHFSGNPDGDHLHRIGAP